MATYVPDRRVRLQRLYILLGLGVVVLYMVCKNWGGSSGDDDVLTSFNDDLPPVDRGSVWPKLHYKGQCPDYSDYSQVRHPPLSQGKYKYPFMRPVAKCRTFVSSSVEAIIDDLTQKVADADLARLIENCLPNTLDTTILWHLPTGAKSKLTHLPQSFVVTGDIHAEWLRDSARQLSVYQPLAKYDAKLRELIKGAINTQIDYVLNSPYCNAFHPPPGSNIKKGSTAMDSVFPRPDWDQVFECKYELDSLASFLTLSNEYYEHTGDSSFITTRWTQALERILAVMKRESQPSFDPRTGQAMNFYYSFQRQTNIGSETLPLGGVGNPVNYNTGLVRSAFRPSDDACIFQLFIPGNIHMVTELQRVKTNFLTSDIKSSIGDLDLYLSYVDKFIHDITAGIEKYGIVDHPKFGKVYAYEVDGYGSSLFMDDANIPSLLSMPDMGFVAMDDEIYQNTRKMILSKEGNPYYLQGRFFQGIGGPHIGIHNAWPMSLLMSIRTSDDDEEIKQNLAMVMDTTAGLGLMHESVNVNSNHGLSYTRHWFAWCNSEFGKTILHLAKYKPHLIFKPEFHTPYDIDKVLRGIDLNKPYNPIKQPRPKLKVPQQ